jgi:hypothetical protein
MTIRSRDLSDREWETLKRFQNRMPQPNLDQGVVDRLKELGLLEATPGGVGLSKTANRLLAQGRQRT